MSCPFKVFFIHMISLIEWHLRKKRLITGSRGIVERFGDSIPGILGDSGFAAAEGVRDPSGLLPALPRIHVSTEQEITLAVDLSCPWTGVTT